MFFIAPIVGIIGLGVGLLGGTLQNIHPHSAVGIERIQNWIRRMRWLDKINWKWFPSKDQWLTVWGLYPLLDIGPLKPQFTPYTLERDQIGFDQVLEIINEHRRESGDALVDPDRIVNQGLGAGLLGSTGYQDTIQPNDHVLSGPELQQLFLHMEALPRLMSGTLGQSLMWVGYGLLALSQVLNIVLPACPCGQ